MQSLENINDQSEAWFCSKTIFRTTCYKLRYFN